MNTKAALLIFAPLVLSVASCTTTEYIPIQPECTAPPKPVLPSIDRGRLWDDIGDERYRVIEQYIDRLWAYSDEQGAIIVQVCDEHSLQP